MSDDGFPPGFFDRADPSPDTAFYAAPRLVTHIDERAVAAVGALYAELGIDGAAPGARRVLDLMGSWVSHFAVPPAELVVLGLNAAELDANTAAAQRVVRDLNADPSLPFPDASFDGVTCCVSVDYLVRPVEVLREAARVLRPGAPLVLTFSDRLFPTKAVRGWREADDAGRCAIAAEYLRRASGPGGALTEPEVSRRTPPDPLRRRDPLFAVVARRT